MQDKRMKYFYDNGTPINAADVINPFTKYYEKKQNGQRRDSMNPTLLDNYITVITIVFESKCAVLQKAINEMEASDYCMYISIMKPKYTKRRHAIYWLLNHLEGLRKTMVRAQQIHSSQINKLQKENYIIRSEMKADVAETPENRERRIILDRNMRTIAFAKRSSREIIRTLTIKNIDPVKEKLEAALEDFVLFSEMLKEKHAMLLERDVCKL